MALIAAFGHAQSVQRLPSYTVTQSASAAHDWSYWDAKIGCSTAHFPPPRSQYASGAAQGAPGGQQNELAIPSAQIGMREPSHPGLPPSTSQGVVSHTQLPFTHEAWPVTITPLAQVVVGAHMPGVAAVQLEVAVELPVPVEPPEPVSTCVEHAVTREAKITSAEVRSSFMLVRLPNAPRSTPTLLDVSWARRAEATARLSADVPSGQPRALGGWYGVVLRRKGWAPCARRRRSVESPVVVRARYPEVTGASCAAEGARVVPERLSVRSMNFGQHWRTPGVVDVDYRVELPRRFLRDVLARELPGYVDDCLKFPDDDPFEVALRARGLPGAEGVAADEALCREALWYFARDLLVEWLGDGWPDEEPGWVLNTVDRVGVLEGVCWVEGRCRRSQAGVKYQDV